MTSRYIDLVIYFYMFICLALLVYNILYIFSDRGKDKKLGRKSARWLKELKAEIRELEKGIPVSSGHQHRMKTELRDVRGLMAYSAAMEECYKCLPRSLIQHYLNSNLSVFQGLAVGYTKRPAVERAFFAYLMGIYRPVGHDKASQLPIILLDFFEDSTVYCRENVLQALYAIGQPAPVENALTMLQDQDIYHNPRLLSDGLSTFTGDREALATRLWKKAKEWNENLQVAVIQFITAVSPSLAPELFESLKNKALQLEGQFAVIRYFQRVNYPPAKDILIDILLNDDNSNLAIAASTALAKYPGDETKHALMQAIHDRNYYVRKNCANSLADIGASVADVEALRRTGDRYATEMLDYVLKVRNMKSSAKPAVSERRKGV